MSVADELNILSSNIDSAYTAISDQGGTLPADKNTSNLASAISSIPSGGGGGSYNPADLQSIYESNRPSDWLELPDANNNEAYFLLQIPANITEPQKLNLKVVTDSSSAARYVAFGTVSGGTFVPDPDLVFTKNNGQEIAMIVSPEKFSKATTQGYKQIVVKVYSSSPILQILEAYTNSSMFPKAVCEVKADLPSLTRPLPVGKLTRFFSLKHSNITSYFENMFNGCASLIAVMSLDTSHGTTFANTFNGCSSLIAIPEIDTSRGSFFNNMFYGCASLTSIPALNTSNGTNFSSMFFGCASLSSIPTLNTSSGTMFSNMFDSCVSLREIDLSGFNFSSATSNGLNSLLGVGGNSLINLRATFSNNTIPNTTGIVTTGNAGVYLPIKIKLPQTSKVSLSNSATDLFTANSWVTVYVPDNLLSTYQTDSNWSVLGTRLKGISEL